MMKKERFWDSFSTWQEAETAWDENKKKGEKECPLKKLTTLPSTVSIVPESRRFLKLKGLSWLLQNDKRLFLVRSFLRHPWRYGKNYLRSLVAPHSYKKREGDFFFFGLDSLAQFHETLQDPQTLFLLGFSYCQKSFECPSGRFSDQCLASSAHPVCGQCFIGKCLNALPEKRTQAYIVPTISFIGQKIFEMKKQFPEKKILFLISTCEMMVEMLGDFSQMVGLTGVAVRLQGRFCNTFQAFLLAEKGVKPGLTILSPHSERKILDALQHWREITH